MPRMRGRLYSSCASSTWSLPSALAACWAKMSRISCVRSTTRGVERVLERPLLRRVELVVDEQHLRARPSPYARLQLLELALADVGARIGRCALLHELADRLDAAPSARAPGARRARRRRRRPAPARASTNPRSGSAPGAGLADASSRGGLCHACRRASSATRPRRAAGRADARARRHLRRRAGTRRRSRRTSASSAARRARGGGDGDDALVRRRAAARRAARRARRPPRHRAGAGQPARAASRTARSHGLGASDMKGGVAVMIELAGVARRRARRRRRSTSALLFFPSGGAAAGREPAPGALRALPRSHEAELAILLEPTDCTIQAGCLGNLNARSSSAARSGHSARPWLADNAIERALEGLAAARCARAASGRDRRARRSREVAEHHAARRAGSPTTSSPTGATATRQLPLRARPQRRRGGGVPPGARPGGRESTSTPATLRRRGSSPTRRSCSALRERRRPRASSRSRRGRTSPTSPPRHRRGQLRPGRDALRARRDEQRRGRRAACGRYDARSGRFSTG